MSELYRHFDEHGALLYVGISLSSAARLAQHKDHSQWFKEIKRVEIERYADRQMALLAEQEAIKKEQPKYNIRHKKVEPIKMRPLAEESAQEILHRVVNFDPLYSAENAARLLLIGMKQMRHMIETREIGHVLLPGRSQHNKPRTFISGWQMIEYLEHLHGRPLP